MPQEKTPEERREALASELNNVAEVAELDLCVEVEPHETDSDRAWVTCYVWHEDSYTKGRRRDRWLVSLAQAMGNARRLPDRTLPEQFAHALQVSHPDVRGIASKQTHTEWPLGGA